MGDCDNCTLCEERQRIVFGSGTHTPIFMIIGEAPGENEDNGGEPFIGMAGKKLDRILDYVGVTRDEIYITNTVLCRPPNNRNPMADEMEACRWRLHLQIDQMKPEFIVLLGKFAVTTYLGQEFKGPLSQFFDEELVINLNDRQHRAIATYHPSYLLRTGRRGYNAVLPHWQKVKGLVDEYRARQEGGSNSPERDVGSGELHKAGTDTSTA